MWRGLVAAIATTCLLVAVTTGSRDNNQDNNLTVSPRVIPSLQSHTTTFEKLGWYSAGRDMGHIIAELSVKPVIEDYNKLVEDLERVHKEAFVHHVLRVNKEDRSLFVMNATFMRLHEILNDVFESLQFACEISSCNTPLSPSTLYPPRRKMKPPSNAKNRVKRQFGVILGTAALGLSVYTLAEVEILKAKLQDTNEQVKHIFSQLSNDHTLVRQNAEHLFTIGQALNDVYKWRSYESFKLGELSLTGYIEDFSVNLQNWIDGFLLVALGKQISPRFFRVEDLDKALQHITEEAKKKGLKPVATAISDLAHEEMSVIKQGSVICVLLHLPLGVAEPYQLYKWVDTPLALSDGRTARVHSNLNLIATNDQFSEHAELASSSLQGCTLRKQIYLCPNGLTSKRMDNTCLGSLFIGEVKKAAELCEFTASFETAETVTPLSGTRVLVYSPPNVTTSVYITCQGGLGSKHLLVHGHSSVEVEKHCLLNTGTFVFKPTRTFDIKDIFVSRPLFGMGPAIIGVLFNKTKTPYFDFTPPKDMPFLNSDVYKVHTAVTLPTIGVFLILLTLPLLALYAWRRKRRRDQSGRRHHVLHDPGETTPLPDIPARADSPNPDGVSSRPLKRPPPPGSKSLPGRERGGWLEMQDHIRRIESLGEGDEQMARI